MVVRNLLIQTREVDTPFEIKANLLALKSKGNNNFVLLLDLKIFDKSFKSLPDGLVIWLHIVLIASAPWNMLLPFRRIAPLSMS